MPTMWSEDIVKTQTQKRVLTHWQNSHSGALPVDLTLTTKQPAMKGQGSPKELQSFCPGAAAASVWEPFVPRVPPFFGKSEGNAVTLLGVWFFSTSRFKRYCFRRKPLMVGERPMPILGKIFQTRESEKQEKHCKQCLMREELWVAHGWKESGGCTGHGMPFYLQWSVCSTITLLQNFSKYG